MKKIFGFTLAETLIVMGIIGVVAALTLPNLNNSTGDKEKVAKVKKIYSNLQDAFGRVTAVYGPIKDWHKFDGSDMGAKKLGGRLADFLKYSKYCDPDVVGDCPSINNMSHSTRFITADGTLIEIYDGQIWIDIDGKQKGKNSAGKDIFSFEFTTGDVVPLGLSPGAKATSNCGYYCTQWVIDNENMDYLKADSTGKCPDGKTILDGTTNITCK